MPSRKPIKPGRKLPGYAASLGIGDAHNMSRSQKRTMSRHFDKEKGEWLPSLDEKRVKRRSSRTPLSRSEKGKFFEPSADIKKYRGGEQWGRRQRNRSNRIIPLKPELIPKVGEIVRLPEGKFSHRTTFDIQMLMPTEYRGHGKHQAEKELLNSDQLSNVAQVRVVVDFSPDLLPDHSKEIHVTASHPSQHSPWPLAVNPKQYFLSRLPGSKTPALNEPNSDAKKRTPAQKDLLEPALENLFMRLDLSTTSRVARRKYGKQARNWLVRTLDGIPITFYRGGHIPDGVGGALWFRVQLERIMRGEKPLDFPLVAQIKDPKHREAVTKSPHFHRFPVYQVQKERIRFKSPEIGGLFAPKDILNRYRRRNTPRAEPPKALKE